MSSSNIYQFYKNWMGFFFFVLMILGITIALTAPSAVISYIIILLAGFLGGKLMYERKDKLRFPYLIIVLGFFIGYLIGAYYGSRLIVMLLFILGYAAGYKTYEKKILKDIKY